MRGLSVIFLVGLVAPASAQPKASLPAIVGATEVSKLAPASSFVDDAVALDGDRLAYVIADSATKAELHVVTLASKQEQIVDLAQVTLQPTALRLVGTRVFVVGKTADDRVTGLLVDPAAKRKIVYRIAPASHITVITRDGKPRIAVHRAAPAKVGTRHTVELLALETGRRIGAARSLDLDGAGNNVKLELRVNHWSDGFTRAHGIMSGAWDRKENERAPDGEASLDVLTGKVFDRHPIKDLFEQRKRFAALVDASGDFIRFTEKTDALELWRAGKKRVLELDQPLATYDPPSLFATIAADGSAWLALKVDPVNPAAVARRRRTPNTSTSFARPPTARPCARRASWRPACATGSALARVIGSGSSSAIRASSAAARRSRSISCSERHDVWLGT